VPLLKKARFAALCKVNRASIGELCAKGTLVVTPNGLIDTDHPANQSYILKHNPSGLLALADPPPARPTKADPPAKRGRKAKADSQASSARTDMGGGVADEEPAPKKGKAGRPGLADLLAASMGLDDIQSEKGEGNAAFSPDEMIEVLRKNLYDAQKTKAEAQLKLVNLDKMHGTLGERDIFESFINELWQSIQQNYIDVAGKQAPRICKILGMVGHEQEVSGVIEGDIKKRMENVKHEIESILRGRLTKSVGIEDEENKETETR